MLMLTVASVNIYTITSHNHLTTLLVQNVFSCTNKSYYNSNHASNNNSVQFDDHQHENMMKDYYKHNQDKMTQDEIGVKIKYFPILKQ